jgi:formate/nitrite transporter FocA (FNT family)
MAWASGRVPTGALVRTGNRIRGQLPRAAVTALLICLAGTHRIGGGAFGIAAMTTAHAKLQLGFGQALVLGILCNGLVCLAVWLSYSARTTTDRILAIVPPVSAFVAAGFEHSIDNMYFMPLGLFIAALDPAFVKAAALDTQAHGLSWSTFLSAQSATRDPGGYHRRLGPRGHRPLLVRLSSWIPHPGRSRA